MAGLGNKEAQKLYQEQNPNTAIASGCRYSFAAALNNGSPWLDIGTNFGYGINPTNQPDIRLDINREYLKPQSGNRIQSNAANLPLASGSVGLVTLFELIEHVPPENLSQVISEAVRVVSPEGKIIISTPNRGAYGNRLSSPDHFQEFSQDELNTLFQQLGLQTIGFFGQGFLKEDSLKTKIIRFCRDSKLISWFYYHGPLFIRNRLRINLQNMLQSNQIRTPLEGETAKNLVFILKPAN